MITLNQVLLLQEKVESAVAKIAQLKAENDALRSKCAELTNALSAKTEQFSHFEEDQGKIERSILQALERLNAVENAVTEGAFALSAAQEAQVASNIETEAEAIPQHTSIESENQAVIEHATTEPTAEEAVATAPEIAAATTASFTEQAPVTSAPQSEAAPLQAESAIQPAFEAPAFEETSYGASSAPVESVPMYEDSVSAPTLEDDISSAQGQFDIF